MTEEPSMADFNAQVIQEFHANDGVVGGMFEGMSLLLLHHTGARSGVTRIAPLAYLPDGDQYVIFGSKGGAPKHPAWYHNLVANPDVTVEVGTQSFAATAVELTGDERDRVFDAMKTAHPQFAGYEEQTDRTIPAVALRPSA